MKERNDWSYGIHNLAHRTNEQMHSEISIKGSARTNVYGDGWQRTKPHRVVARFKGAILRPYYGKGLSGSISILSTMRIYFARIPSQARFKYKHVFKL